MAVPEKQTWVNECPRRGANDPMRSLTAIKPCFNTWLDRLFSTGRFLWKDGVRLFLAS